MIADLQIKKLNLDLIEAGTKKTEWRDPSLFNKKKLFYKREKDGKWEGNPDIKEIKFINGYNSDRKIIFVECLGIRMVKFTRDVNIPEDNFQALEGQFAIEIKLGGIINKIEKNEE